MSFSVLLQAFLRQSEPLFKKLFPLKALALAVALSGVVCTCSAFGVDNISICIKSPAADAQGSGKFPYNFRSIDGHLFAGGSLFNPVTGANSDELVRRYLRLLKSLGVHTVIKLDVPQKPDEQMQRLRRLCAEEGLELFCCRMTAEEIPSATQTIAILKAIDNGAYVHCLWGCDRTGAIIAKYLRERCGWNGYDAWKAVISKGSHAGPLGGLKQTPAYGLLIRYFWPEVASESPEVSDIYKLK